MSAAKCTIPENRHNQLPLASPFPARPFNYDKPMRRSLTQIACCLCLPLLFGCSQSQPAARKEIKVPEVGPPGLVSLQRPVAGSSLVAPAAYEQPAELPQTLRPFENWSDQEAAEDALGRIGAAAVPALVQALHSADLEVRRKAIEVLGRMGDEAAASVPDLIPLLDDPDPQIRKSAARTLGQIGPSAKDAVPALMRTLLQPQPRTSTTAR
jgi:hypothetical protein